MTGGLTLDAGALIGIERGDPATRAMVREALDANRPIHVVAGVVAQTWRGGGRQARLARFLAAEQVRIRPLGEVTARAVGELCAISGTSDVTDAHVVLDARLHGHAVLTSDPDDLGTIDPRVRLIVL